MKFVILVGCLVLAGCNLGAEGVSPTPMLKGNIKHFGMPPWQVVTYDNEKVTHGILVAVDGSIKPEEKTVYISKKSQFVYKDGTKIRNSQGNYLYWNENGKIINHKLVEIPKEMIFTVNGLPIDNKATLKLKNI